MTSAVVSGKRKVVLLLLVLAFGACASDETRFEGVVARAAPLSGQASSKRTVLVLMKERPSLGARQGGRPSLGGPRGSREEWKRRGERVVRTLRDHGALSQAPIRAFLAARGIAHKAFWVVNALRVTADAATLAELEKRGDVERVIDERIYAVPPLQSDGQALASPSASSSDPNVTWGLANIRAPDVWRDFGVEGDGIVVANIDTGVQFDHPALAQQYRGNAGGAFDHNYNWYDPGNICGFPSSAPCDTSGHGTHTMGTMVGDDGQGNQIGVAPRAKWIAVNACDSRACAGLTTSSLLGAAQWILAPTDLNGVNPRPDLRPHIVNNSWGGDPDDETFRQVVEMWVEAGVFPVFSQGNWAGFPPAPCGSAASPGDYPESYAVGAYDIDDAIAEFSLRGPSFFEGAIKPDIVAPGVAVRSSYPPSSYLLADGTSMAAPHVAGSIALLWSAAPTLVGDVAATRALLGRTAAHASELLCGGSSENNAVFGQGRLNVLAAVEQAPRGPAGTLQGRVTDSLTGEPIARAAVHLLGATDRTIVSDASGNYRALVAAGTYDVEAKAFGYQPRAIAGLEVPPDQSLVQDFSLAVAPSFTLSGFVRKDDGTPVTSAEVTVLGTPLATAITDDGGHYAFSGLPMGSYALHASGGSCLSPKTTAVVVENDGAADVTLPQRFDGYGYGCRPADFAFIEANTVLPLSGDDSGLQIALPFPFVSYGKTYDTVNVTTNGFVSFASASPFYANDSIPDPFLPNAAIYAFWDDLIVPGLTASVRTELVGSAPERQFVIEWRDARIVGTTLTVRFEIVLSETGSVLLQYLNAGPDPRQRGASATVGIEDETGSAGLKYLVNEPVLRSGQAVRFDLRPSGFIAGTVAGAGGVSLAGATVRAMQGDVTVRSTTTDAAGQYRMLVPVGTYDLALSAFGYRDLRVEGLAVEPAGITLPDRSMDLGPSFVVSGHLRDEAGRPIANARVSLVGTPLTPAVADADGFYSMGGVPAGTYTVLADAAGCYERAEAALAVADGDGSLDLALAQHRDEYGYRCELVPSQFIEANTIVPLSGFFAEVPVALPFSFPFYGRTYDSVQVTTSGFLHFSSPSFPTTANVSIPASFDVNAAIYPFWDGLWVDDAASVRTEIVGVAPDRQLVVEWRNVRLFQAPNPDARVRFEAVLGEGGTIVTQYQGVGGDPFEAGGSATVGIENETGTVALQYSFERPVLRSEQAIVFNPPVAPP